MASPALSIPVMTFAVLFVIGGLLFIVGLRGRRVGDEPRCRKCNYNLTGLTSTRCPECGSAISDRNTVIGTRRRGKWALILGTLLFLIPLTGLGLVGYARAKGANWYPHLPTFIVLQAAKTDDRDAITELTSRYTAGQIKSDRLLALVPHALEVPIADDNRSVVGSWQRLLATMDANGVLSKAQKEQFYARVGSFELRFRSPVRQGDMLEIRSRRNALAPGVKIRWLLLDADLRVGGLKLPTRCRGVNPVPSPPWMSTSPLEPGLHRVILTGRQLFLYGDDTSWLEPSFVREISQEYALEILPADAPDPLRMVADPTLAAEFLAAVSFRIAPLGQGSTRMRLFIDIDNRVPMDGAFELFALIGEREIPLGPLLIRKDPGRHTEWCFDWTIFSTEDAKHFVPILRTRESFARDMPDMFEVWDGELIFDPVPLPQSPPPAPTGKAGGGSSADGP